MKQLKLIEINHRIRGRQLNTTEICVFAKKLHDSQNLPLLSPKILQKKYIAPILLKNGMQMDK